MRREAKGGKDYSLGEGMHVLAAAHHNLNICMGDIYSYDSSVMNDHHNGEILHIIYKTAMVSNITVITDRKYRH